MVSFCVCLSVFVCPYVFPVCAVKKDIQEAGWSLPVCVCLSVCVCLYLFVCIYLSLFVCLYVFPVCAVEKEIQEAVMPSRHIGQLAVSLSSQTANARFSSSLLKKKSKYFLLERRSVQNTNYSYSLINKISSSSLPILLDQNSASKSQSNFSLNLYHNFIIHMIMVLMQRSVGVV